MSHEAIARVFDDWAKRGRDAGMERGHGDVVRQVVEAMGVNAGEQVLDLGCGNGWATRMIAQAAPGASAVGLDVSPEMVARAEELHELTIRARYVKGTFEQIDFKDDKFGRVFSMEALYYSPDLERALTEIHRVLKPGGVADVVMDRYRERAATEAWSEQLGLGMAFLSEEEWGDAFRRAGFMGIETRRVIDSRGPGEESSFEPDEHHETFADWADYVEQGSLWIRALKPA